VASFEYLEIRNARLELIGIIDDATSMIWHRVFYGIGDFDIEVAKTKNALSLLRKGHFVTRHDCDEIGIIEHVDSDTNEAREKVLTASGRFAKVLLNIGPTAEPMSATMTKNITLPVQQVLMRKEISFSIT
jgi:hypothetical protein